MERGRMHQASEKSLDRTAALPNASYANKMQESSCETSLELYTWYMYFAQNLSSRQQSISMTVISSARRAPARVLSPWFFHLVSDFWERTPPCTANWRSTSLQSCTWLQEGLRHLGQRETREKRQTQTTTLPVAAHLPLGHLPVCCGFFLLGAKQHRLLQVPRQLSVQCHKMSAHRLTLRRRSQLMQPFIRILLQSMSMSASELLVRQPPCSVMCEG
jgi:hypothetical protein